MQRLSAIEVKLKLVEGFIVFLHHKTVQESMLVQYPDEVVYHIKTHSLCQELKTHYLNYAFNTVIFLVFSLLRVSYIWQCEYCICISHYHHFYTKCPYCQM